ncbi:hypothetical protein [Evansella cellulosilytica]|uniref:Putative sensor histidine kinase n=1 Tax=Evansella cellulosilytica (strain ATCC 21833 / DSM 2522 / FERM P-1141 / JCM 9156 / N-4) TaxID=649639 RepID=E6TYE4_EVAC2|nr:hypothetical protein [Evansella cellulosilytica]ADU28882.1 putative sensor histidine kinase [Evansella cellulosilytica DSM 2522]
MKINALNPVLYITSLLLIIIPTIIVLASDTKFSSTFSYIVINSAIALIIIGMSLTALQKRREGETISYHVGGAIGLSIVLVIRLFEISL